MVHRWGMSLFLAAALHGGAVAGVLLWGHSGLRAPATPSVMLVELAPQPEASVLPDVAVAASSEPEVSAPTEPVLDRALPIVEAAQVAAPEMPDEVPEPAEENLAEPPQNGGPAREATGPAITAAAVMETPDPPGPSEPSARPRGEGAASTAASAELVAWQSTLLGHLERHKRYPKDARRKRREGTAYVRFVLDRNGRVLAHKLERSAGTDALDREALDLIQRAQPLPPPPGGVGDTVEIVVPVVFRIR